MKAQKLGRNIAVTAILLATTTQAQITLQSTAQETLISLRSLTGGAKLMPAPFSGSISTFPIYNMDLSLYRTIVIPDPPTGYNWSVVQYITETLFDTDENTIEYMLVGNGQGPNNDIVSVADEFGTVLFSKSPGTAFSVLGGSPIDEHPYIFETANGAVMLLQTDINSPTEVYSLPGHVPCVSDCYPAATSNFNVDVEDFHTQGSAFTVQSPSDSEALVSYQLPKGATNGMLDVLDSAGRLIMTIPLGSGGTHMLSTLNLKAGNYLVRLRSSAGNAQAQKLIVVH